MRFGFAQCVSSQANDLPSRQYFFNIFLNELDRSSKKLRFNLNFYYISWAQNFRKPYRFWNSLILSVSDIIMCLDLLLLIFIERYVMTSCRLLSHKHNLYCLDLVNAQSYFKSYTSYRIITMQIQLGIK